MNFIILLLFPLINLVVAIPFYIQPSSSEPHFTSYAIISPTGFQDLNSFEKLNSIELQNLRMRGRNYGRTTNLFDEEEKNAFCGYEYSVSGNFDYIFQDGSLEEFTDFVFQSNENVFSLSIESMRLGYQDSIEAAQGYCGLEAEFLDEFGNIHLFFIVDGHSTPQSITPTNARSKRSNISGDVKTSLPVGEISWRFTGRRVSFIAS